MSKKWSIVMILGGALAGAISSGALEVLYLNKTIKQQSEHIDSLYRLIDMQDRYIDVLKRVLNIEPEDDSETVTAYADDQPVAVCSRRQFNDD